MKKTEKLTKILTINFFSFTQEYKVKQTFHIRGKHQIPQSPPSTARPFGNTTRQNCAFGIELKE